MKKLLALILALVMVIGVVGACKPQTEDNDKPTEKPAESGKPAESDQPTESTQPAESDQPTESTQPADPTDEPKEFDIDKVVELDHFEAVEISNKEYGVDYESVYDHMGKEFKIADVIEDPETGLAYYMDDEGNLHPFGLDFLSMAMVYNVDPEGSKYADADEVYAAWWRYYITRWNELLPEIPLYSNEYYDLYNAKIKGVEEHPTNPYWGPTRALYDWTSEKDDKSIILGNSTELSGQFRVSSFGKNSPGASDNDVSYLCNELSTATSNSEGNYQWNDTVTKAHEETENADGSKTFQITIHDDLKFSDGSPITAKNFIVSSVAGLTPVYTQAASRELSGRSVVGWEGEYQIYAGPGTDGAKELKGIRLIDEYTFSVTVPASQLPYYYDITFAAFSPMALGIYLPEGVDIHDDGNGCYLDDEFYKKDGDTFTHAARIKDIMTNPTNENYKKYPWAGAYMVDNYDQAASQVTLVKNPHFKGNHNGSIPSIEKVVYRKIVPATQLEDFKNGGIDLIAGITGGKETDEALNAADTSNGAFKYIHYSRAGYGKLAMRCDYGPVQFTEVRKAIAYCMDRAQFAKDFTGGYGGVVDGPYYTGGWMYKEAVKQGLSLDKYATSADSAIKVLEEGGWVYNADGSDYSGSGVRYKKIPGEFATEHDIAYQSMDGAYKTEKIGDDYYMPLVINWFGTVENEFTDLLQTGFRTNANIENAGFKVYSQTGDFGPMLDEFYQQPAYGFYSGSPMYCAFNFATSFNSAVYDFSYNLTIDPSMYDDYSNYYIKDSADIFVLK